MGLIRFLAIAFLIYWAVRLLMRFVMPFLAKYVLKKASQKMQNQMNQQPNSSNSGDKIYDRGDVEIRTKPKSSSSDISSAGDDEYVDFEEVKD